MTTWRVERTSAWQAINALTRAAYEREGEFLWGLECALFGRADEMKGAETYLYAIYDETEAIKFGIALKPHQRLSQLQGANPRRLTLVAVAPGTLALERFIHTQLASERLVREWFRASSRTLAVVEILIAAEEMAQEVEEDGQRADCESTVAGLTAVAEDIARRVAA